MIQDDLLPQSLACPPPPLHFLRRGSAVALGVLLVHSFTKGFQLRFLLLTWSPKSWDGLFQVSNLIPNALNLLGLKALYYVVLWTRTVINIHTLNVLGVNAQFVWWLLKGCQQTTHTLSDTNALWHRHHAFYTYKHTHAHTHARTHTHTHRERERERERD